MSAVIRNHQDGNNKVDFKYNKTQAILESCRESFPLQSAVCLLSEPSNYTREAGFLLHTFFYSTKTLQAVWVIWLLPNIQDLPSF